MSRGAKDINAKIAYLTNRWNGPPALKIKRPLVLNNNKPGFKVKKADGRLPSCGFIAE